MLATYTVYPRLTIMPRQTQTQIQLKATEPTPFGAWLTSARERRGLSINAFARAVGISNAHVSKMESGKSNASRDMVGHLVAALSGPDSDEHVSTHLLNEGLRAAGFAPNDDDFAPEHPAIDYLRGQPGPVQDRALKLLRAAFDSEDAADDAANIGKRAE